MQVDINDLLDLYREYLADATTALIRSEARIRFLERVLAEQQQEQKKDDA